MLSDVIILKYWLTDEIAILPDNELNHTFEANIVNKSLVCSKKDYNLGFAV